MEALALSDLVLSKEVLDAFTKEEKPTLKQYKNPIPEDIKGFIIPSDINWFITRIYPNMQTYVKAKLLNRGDASVVDSIINNFVVYMLDQNKDGKLRYSTYDSKQFPDQPFYKWWIQNLKFFYLTYQQQLLRDQFIYTLSETTFDSTMGNKANHAIHIDQVSMKDSVNIPEEHVLIGEVARYLKEYSEQYQNCFCFEAYAYELFLSRFMGESNNDFSKRLSISPSASSQWILKLRSLVSKLLEQPELMSVSIAA